MPNVTELTALADQEAFPAPLQSAVRRVAHSLVQSDEKPQEFFATVEHGEERGRLVFHLWHMDAFKPENRMVLGNPSDKCRDVHYDAVWGRVVKTLFWQ